MSAQGMDRETVERVAAWLADQGKPFIACDVLLCAMARWPAPEPGPRSISHWGMFE